MKNRSLFKIYCKPDVENKSLYGPLSSAIQMLVVIFLVGVLLGCSEEDNPCENTLDFTNLLHERTNALSAATIAYDDDPSPANCQNYKNSFREYWSLYLDAQECGRGIEGLPFAIVPSEEDLEQEIARLCP